MTTIVNTIAKARVVIDKDAPDPIEWWREGSDGVPEERDSTLIAEITCGDTVLTKSVGSGITLSDYLDVTDAFVTLQLTSEEIADFPRGLFTFCEFREGASDPKRLILKTEIVLE